MRNVRSTVLVIVLAGLTAGCLSIKSYVDPFLPQVGYGDLLPRREVRLAVVTVVVHRNGEPASLGTSRARDEICTGITLGGAGSRVTDGYVFTVKFQRASAEPQPAPRPPEGRASLILLR